MKLIVTFVLLTCSYYGYSQNCSLTIGEFYKSLKSINPESSENLNYKKYKSFNFEKFMPTYGIINQTNYCEVGFDGKHQIKEIIQYDSSWCPMKMTVYYFEKYKIMTLKYKASEGKDYEFMPVAFLLTDNHRFMITLQQVTGIEPYQFGNMYINFPLGSLKDISSIMTLDENWNTIQCVVAHEGYIQISYEFDYEKASHKLKYELVRVFLSTKTRAGHKLDESFCLDNLSRFLELADFSFVTEPRDYKEGHPLWMYGGTGWHK